MITFVRTVGTAPGTTTMQLGAACPPDPLPLHIAHNQNIRRAKPEAGIRQQFINPDVDATVYADKAAFKGLGIATYPATINRTLTTNSGYNPAPSFDYQFNQNAVDGFYYDTPLGAIPTDDELAKNHCYTPVHSGWVKTLGEAFSDMTSHQKWTLALQVFATTAITTVAAVTVYRAVTGK